MFGLGLPEILIILVIVLLLFGAKRLPEIGEGIGRTIGELRNIRGERRKDQEEKEGKQGDLVSDLKKDIEEIPGLKEAKEIRDTAKKVKNITRFLK